MSAHEINPNNTTPAQPSARTDTTSAAAVYRKRSPRWWTVLELLLVFGVFALHGSWPVPDVNETHYLTKSKNYWDPTWCANDFFLQTSDAHLVFYWTVGWLTKFVSLPELAWAMRIFTWMLLAWSFRRLSWAVVPWRWMAPLGAVLFVCLTESAHMAGEWIIGGVEAKCFAYVFVLLGLEALVVGRWLWVPILLGLAAMFHVLVGGWAMVCAGVVWLASARERPPLVKLAPSLIVGLLLSLPALVPALQLTGGAPADVVAEANRIYVVERLPHHLQLDKFNVGFVARHVLLATMWLLLCTITPATPGERRLRWFVVGALGLATIGFLLVLIARVQPGAVNGLLRYYWFRTSDIVTPLGVVMTGLSYLVWLRQTRPPLAKMWFAALVLVAVVDLAGQANLLRTATGPRADKNMAYANWRDVCAWVSEHTPADAVFITPRLSGTFKWYTDRGEVVTWKDVPQDATAIVAWWKRMRDVFERPNPRPGRMWRESNGDHGAEGLARLAREYGAQYAIVELLPESARLPLTPEYENGSYAVYRIGEGQ